jgi:hypothetical protein
VRLAMNPGRGFRVSCGLALFFLFTVSAIAQNRPTLFPAVHSGQKLTYQIRLRIDKRVRSESRVAAPIVAPAPDLVDIMRTITVEVLDVDAANPKTKLALRLQILDPNAVPPTAKTLELSVRPDGSVNPPQQSDELSAEDTQAWQAWVARFAIAWSFPTAGPKVNDKWSSEEAVTGAPLAQLSWQKQSQYVRQEKCPAAQSANERCAVLLTTSILKQRSSPKDATPDDYKLRGLKSRGTAKGRNEMFTYISLDSGLVLRSSEEAHQFMDVIIGKADGSNQVHYNIDASSSTEMLLMPDVSN